MINQNDHIKKFVVTSILLFVIVIVIMLILNTIHVALVDNQKVTYRREKIYENYVNNLPEKKIKFAFIGDSHAGDGINPEIIPESFNFATNGETYFKTYYKLRKIYEMDNVSIEYLFVEADWNTLSDKDIEDQRWILDWDLYAKFMSYDEIREVYDANYFELFFREKFPFIGNGQRLGIIIAKPELTDIYLGHTRNTNMLTQDKKEELINMTEPQKLTHGNTKYSNVSIKYFKKTLELAKEKGTKIILIKYPITKLEFDHIVNNNNITTEEYYNFLYDTVEEVIGKDYIVLDYHDIFFENEEYFADLRHLHYTGADILSEKVYSDLVKLGIIQKENQCNKINYDYSNLKINMLNDTINCIN